MSPIGTDAEKGSEVNFDSTPEGRKACARWLQERGFMEIVKEVADVFFDGKLNQRPRCFEESSKGSQAEVATDGERSGMSAKTKR